MKKLNKLGLPLLAITLLFGMQSCKKKDKDEPTTTMMSSTYNYQFNNGQIVASAAYNGTHQDNLSASMKVEELANGHAKITVTLMNTVNGATYHTHAHDAADPATTPNGTPYNETPNAGVYSQMIVGNGGTVSMSQETMMSYAQITSVYSGFLVVHDPLQPLSTTNLSTYVILGTFARTQSAALPSMMYMYNFNTGQVSPTFAYQGTHANTLMGHLRVQALADGTSRVTVILNNSMSGQTYYIHAHDAADPATTPNGTPYNETPNSSICTLAIQGNGGDAYASQFSTISLTDLSSTYNGFFVVHDPLQAISTTDPTTYVLLGLFAR
jgi:hypothetical protein